MNATPLIVDHRNVGAAFRRLSLPLALQILGDQLLSVVDTVAIGAIGTVALAGATAATTVFFTCIMTVAGLWSGTSIIASQRVGAGDMEGYGRTVRAGFLFPCAASVAVALASLLASVPIARAMLGNVPAAGDAAVYLTLRSASLIPLNLSAVLVTSLGAAGNRNLGIYVLALINAVHIPLLAILAFGWLTHRAYGVAGAGVSSLIAEGIAAVFSFVYVRRRPVYRIFSRLDFSWRLAARSAWLGLPESVFGFTILAPDIAIVAMLAPLGALAIAGFRALNVVSDLTFVVPSPLQSATQIVIGQRLGARDPDGALHFLRRARRLTLVISSIAAAVVAALAWPFAYVMTLNAAAAGAAALPLALHMATLPIKSWAMVSLAPIRASGDTRFSLVLGLLCAGIVLPIAYACIVVLHLGLYAVPIAWIAAWGARAAATEIKLSRGRWSSREPVAV